MISPERLKGITAFVQAVEAGSFTLAADRMGLTKSGVAKSVARLEEKLGVRLIARTTRHFSLTDEGQAFYDSCVRALAELESAEAAVSSQRRAPSGRLRIDLPHVFGRRWVLPALLDIGAAYPELRMEVSFSDRLVDPIEEGIDLVIRIGDLRDSAVLVARRLGVQASVVCASPAYVAAHGAPRSIDDLDRHACIVFGRDGRTNPWLFVGADGKPISKQVAGRYVFNHSEANREAARAGQGLALLATWLVADDLRTGQLVDVMPGVATLGFPIHAVWPRTRHLAPKVRVVVDDLVQRFSPRPPWEVAPGRV
ncbi:LysR substrate-binding domain-containing protein [Bradyrhizobium sp. 2TAF24]|uniref:LysR substrate-binding domain-containing protein n=1 Tax=Bradyrhizobium sp. 2TAF24 TaxID=3233011 RepID=UPI003F90FB60